MKLLHLYSQDIYIYIYIYTRGAPPPARSARQPPYLEIYVNNNRLLMKNNFSFKFFRNIYLYIYF